MAQRGEATWFWFGPGVELRTTYKLDKLSKNNAKGQSNRLFVLASLLCLRAGLNELNMRV